MRIITCQQGFTSIVTEALLRGDTVRLPVQGGSMRPWLREGDLVQIVPAAGRTLRRGDILLFMRRPDRPVLHRLWQVSPGADGLSVCHCRGDAEYGSPEPVPPAKVVGVVEQAFLFGRWRRLSQPAWRRAGLVWQGLGPLRAPILAVLRRLYGRR